MTFDQYILGLLGVTALWLSQSEDEACRKWAPVFGLLSQPLWIYTSWTHGQWGIVVLCGFYTLAWCRGIKVYWMRST